MPYKDPYHQDRSRLNNSAKECFRRQGPEVFKAIYVDDPPSMDRKPSSPAQLLGQAVHTLALEPGQFSRRFAVAPDCNGRTTEGRQRKAAFALASKDQDVIMPDQHERASMAADALSADPWWSSFMASTPQCEPAVEWTDHGVPAKAKLDALLLDPIEQENRLVDLKTFEPSGIGRYAGRMPTKEVWVNRVIEYGYHRQAAWYLSGVNDKHGVRPVFYHVVVVTVEPFLVFVYRLPEELLLLGLEENTSDVLAIKACYQTGDWRCRERKQVTTLSVPRWMLRTDAE